MSPWGSLLHCLDLLSRLLISQFHSCSQDSDLDDEASKLIFVGLVASG